MTSDAIVVDVTEDWESACDVQQRLMEHPRQSTDYLTCSARCRQLRALGGDFYNFLPLAHNRLAMVIGDASGKGLAAALMTASVQSSLRTAASFAGDDLPTLLGAVNQQVHASSLPERYVTLFYGEFDRESSMLKFVNAGHNSPLLVQRNGVILPLESGGLPLGIFPDSTYEQGSVYLNSGDIVIAYTDGVTEAINGSGEEWGIERLQKAAAESGALRANEVVEAIFRSLDEFSRGCQTDDATVAAVRVP
jgi:sigma-B regulation protein RsbU (phosphoserine phosphatase)